MARYRGASACNSDFHRWPFTSTRNTPSEKARARVRSATAEPQTTGQAISGASARGASRNDCATIFSRPDPACCTRVPSPSDDSFNLGESLILTFSLYRKFAPHKFERRIPRSQSALQLRIFHRGKNLAEFRPRRVPLSNQIIARHQRCGTHLLRLESPPVFAG